jgi:hypothetical protein
VLCRLPHSSDLAPRDFNLFWPLKDTPSGRHYLSDAEVEEAVHDLVAHQPNGFFSVANYALVEPYRNCAERGGDCAGNYCHCGASVYAVNHCMVYVFAVNHFIYIYVFPVAVLILSPAFTN